MLNKLATYGLSFACFAFVVFLLIARSKRLGEIMKELEQSGEVLDNVSKAKNAHWRYNTDVDYADIVRKTFARK